jgi:hypothetical protein
MNLTVFPEDSDSEEEYSDSDEELTSIAKPEVNLAPTLTEVDEHSGRHSCK